MPESATPASSRARHWGSALSAVAVIVAAGHFGCNQNFAPPPQPGGTGGGEGIYGIGGNAGTRGGGGYYGVGGYYGGAGYYGGGGYYGHSRWGYGGGAGMGLGTILLVLLLVWALGIIH